MVLTISLFFSLIISPDCCVPDTVGEINYKGVYNFPAILAGTSYPQNCTYGNVDFTTQPVIRRCTRDMADLPQWSSFNLTECQPKTETTKFLIILVQVCVLFIAKNLAMNLFF